MIVVIREWYSARSLRERRLLVIMLAVAVPLLVWLAVVQPISRAYQAALDRHLQAVDRHGRIRALVEGPRTEPVRTRAPGGDLALIVTDSAAQAGITLDSNSPAGPDSVSISDTQAAATAVTSWLGALEAQGVRIEELRITPSGADSVSMTARLSRSSR